MCSIRREFMLNVTSRVDALVRQFAEDEEKARESEKRREKEEEEKEKKGKEKELEEERKKDEEEEKKFSERFSRKFSEHADGFEKRMCHLEENMGKLVEMFEKKGR